MESRKALRSDRTWSVLNSQHKRPVEEKWRTVGGGGGVQPLPPKFRSFDKTEPSLQFRGKCILNNLIRTRASLITNWAEPLTRGLPPPDPRWAPPPEQNSWVRHWLGSYCVKIGTCVEGAVRQAQSCILATRSSQCKPSSGPTVKFDSPIYVYESSLFAGTQ
jgi:hypothetical protein